MQGQFKIGDRVNHPVSGTTPSGTGTVAAVIREDSGVIYKVSCDKTGQTLEATFKESELSPVQ